MNHEKLKCPCCKSENIKDESTYKSNGILGPGGSSWKVLDMRSCAECGVLFKPITKDEQPLSPNEF